MATAGQEGVRVGFLGQPGSFSDDAARTLLSPLLASDKFQGVGLPSYEALFQSVADHKTHCALIFFESTLGGSLHTNYDLLLQYSHLHILAEVDLQVRHCLLALPGTKRDSITRVLSHQAVLRECDEYLGSWGVVTESRPDSVSAAKEVVERGLIDTAVIGSERCATEASLDILERNVQGIDDRNFSRSLLIGSEPCKVEYPEGTTMKTSIVFWLPHTNSALFKILSIFSNRDINLTKLESRPVPAAYKKKFAGESAGDGGKEADPRLYEYFVYIDVTEHHESPNMVAALRHLRQVTPFVQVFGSYPAFGVKTDGLCQALIAQSAQAVAHAPQPTTPQLKICILGFGNFGQFLAKEFIKKHQVFATSRGSYEKVCKEMNVTWVPYERLEDLFLVHKVDVFLISTSIPSFESVVKSLPRAALETGLPLVVDVCSVKAFPKNVMLDNLPEGCDIVCTHPMFGPESGKYGWQGLAFVFEIVRTQHENGYDRARRFIKIFQDAKCRMVCMSCEEHDQLAADSQFLTHLTGRILSAQGCSSTPLDLKSFTSLMKVVDTTCKDSFDLFYGLFKYNVSANDTIAKLKQAFSDIETKLRFRREGSAQSVPAIAWPAAEGQDDDLRVSSRMERISESKTAAVQALSKKLKDEGKKVNSALCIGEPDYQPPPEVLQAIGKAGDEGHTHYSVVQGDLELRRCVCDYLRESKGVSYEPSQICVSNGGKQAIYQAVMAVCEPGDVVLVPTPCWVSYHDIAQLCQAQPVSVTTTAEEGYLLSAAALEKALQANASRCKVLVLCNPCNPTGAVLPRESLEAIAAVLRRPEFAHIYVLADEIYEQLVFDTPHACFASLEGMRERTLLIGGFSKGFAMTGLRLGYLAAETAVTAAATKLQGQITSCASTVSQRAGITALRSVGPDWLQARLTELRQKRDFVVKRLRSIQGVACPVPEGAFYAFADLSGVLRERGLSGTHFCTTLLQDHGVALVPGEAFHADMSVRLSYAATMEDLQHAMDSFEACVTSLRSAH